MSCLPPIVTAAPALEDAEQLAAEQDACPYTPETLSAAAYQAGLAATSALTALLPLLPMKLRCDIATQAEGLMRRELNQLVPVQLKRVDEQLSAVARGIVEQRTAEGRYRDQTQQTVDSTQLQGPQPGAAVADEPVYAAVASGEQQ